MTCNNITANLPFISLVIFLRLILSSKAVSDSEQHDIMYFVKNEQRTHEHFKNIPDDTLNTLNLQISSYLESCQIKDIDTDDICIYYLDVEYRNNKRKLITNYVKILEHTRKLIHDIKKNSIRICWIKYITAMEVDSSRSKYITNDQNSSNDKYICAEKNCIHSILSDLRLRLEHIFNKNKTFIKTFTNVHYERNVHRYLEDHTNIYNNLVSFICSFQSKYDLGKDILQYECVSSQSNLSAAGNITMACMDESIVKNDAWEMLSNCINLLKNFSDIETHIEFKFGSNYIHDISIMSYHSVFSDTKSSILSLKDLDINLETKSDNDKERIVQNTDQYKKINVSSLLYTFVKRCDKLFLLLHNDSLLLNRNIKETTLNYRLCKYLTSSSVTISKLYIEIIYLLKLYKSLKADEVNRESKGLKVYNFDYSIKNPGHIKYMQRTNSETIMNIKNALSRYITEKIIINDAGLRVYIFSNNIRHLMSINLNKTILLLKSKINYISKKIRDNYKNTVS